jgi:hypothetical protein
MSWKHIVVACLLAGGSLGAFVDRLDAQFNQSATTQGVSGGGGGCTQATNFLARATGMDSTHNTAFTTMICGLVTDGVITGSMSGSATSGAAACGSLLDILYIFATDTNPHSLLNLCSKSFTATVNTSPTFIANAGWTGVDGFIDSTYLSSTAGATSR